MYAYLIFILPVASTSVVLPFAVSGIGGIPLKFLEGLTLLT